MGLSEHLETRFSQRIQSRMEKISESPADWIERYFYVPDPRDPLTGDFLPPGPMRLSEHQRRIINEALSKKPDGTYKYSTVVYSAPKKSGKSAVAAAVTLYMAYNRPDSNVYCLANDGKQSADRIYEPIKKCIIKHKQAGGPLKDEEPNKTDITLSNGTKIEAIPCDAAGEAGSQPMLSVWSELWAFNSEAKRRLWTELTVPPTLFGYAMRWVESYAGEKGKSELLEQLYDLGVVNGTPHPDFLDLVDKDGTPVVRVNEAAGIFCYWDHIPRMLWQTKAYYAQESMIHTASEFARIHLNEWVSPVDAFIQPEMWEGIRKEVGLIRGNTPVILAVDGAISNDYAAILGSTRDREDSTHTLLRFCYIFTPAKSGGTIKISETVEPKIRELCKQYNVICCAYDPYQLEDMAQRLRKDKVVWMYAFGQQSERVIADKGFYDGIINKTLWWDALGPNMALNGDLPTLSQHVLQAGSKADNGKLRLVKIADKLKIDAAVAASMAHDRCKNLNISNRESEIGNLLREHSRGNITDKAFLESVRASRT